MPKELAGIGLVYTGQEVANMFGVSIYTVLRDYRLGRLAGRHFGRQIFFTGDSIKAFLESGRPARRHDRGQAGQEQAGHRLPPTTREQDELLEKNRIIDIMRITGNHRKEAAKRMGFSEVTLRAKFKKYGLDFPSNKGIRGKG